MSRIRKYGKLAVLFVVLLIAAQLNATLLVKTHRVRGYLIARLARTFGRPVEASRFSVQLLPMPRLDIEGVTIGEDPSFGHEYFLRAERMDASLRWMGLLRGKFEFGTMSLTRPSLILVRNGQGRWNLEGWLPPVRTKAPGENTFYGPRPPSEAANFLQKIEFDDGRINFKMGVDKKPFAFTNVSGSVEQMGPGRWQLRLEAQPWRSGVALQSTGIIQVRGDVAGTSARLQPAQIRLHWDKVPLADLFRLVTGNDPGVRGELALDGIASIGTESSGPSAGTGKWKFELQARATQIHRWDLTERSDNPRVNLNLQGVWDLTAGEARAEQMTLELPSSTVQGNAVLQTRGPAAWNVRVNSLSIRGADVLAWCRAFQPGIAESISLDESFRGELAVSGWPLHWDSAKIASEGGSMAVPGFPQPLRIDPFAGRIAGSRLIVEPVRIRLGAGKTELVAPVKPDTLEKTKPGKTVTKPVALPPAENAIEAALLQDFSSDEGRLNVSLRLSHVTRLFKLAAAFGKTLNHGWELNGEASARLDWEWQHNLKNVRWKGYVDLKKAELQAAGLNLPLKLEDVSVEWKEGRRAAEIRRAEAFGATWSGTIEEGVAKGSAEENQWQFQFHADHLDATDLDRWVGPRTRPNWLQRLLPSLLGGGDSGGKASELLRRVSAEGELSVDSLTIEKIKLAQAHAKLSLRDLHLEVRDAEAEWAGGSLRGNVQAQFSPLPRYEIAADLDGVNLAQLPWAPHWAERWSGLASGTIHFTTSGVGREELLKQLAGRGEVRLKDVELRGWDVTGSVESGAVRPGVSRWTSGAGEFVLRDRALDFEALQLEAPHTRIQLTGSFGFGQDAKLTFSLFPAGKPGARSVPAKRVLQVSGALDSPQVAVETAAVVQKKP